MRRDGDEWQESGEEPLYKLMRYAKNLRDCARPLVDDFRLLWREESYGAPDSANDDSDQDESFHSEPLAFHHLLNINRGEPANSFRRFPRDLEHQGAG